MKNNAPWILAVAAVCLTISVASTGQAGPLDADQVSADAKWVMHMDFEAMRESSAGKMMRSMWLQRDRVRKRMEEVLEHTGMDPREDLDGATLYDNQFKKHHGVALIHVKNIDKSRSLDTLREKHPDARTVTYEGHEIHTWQGRHKKHEHTVTAALYEGSVIVMSRNIPDVMQALDVLDGRADALSDSSPLADDTRGGTILTLRAIDMDEAGLPGKCSVLQQSEQLSWAAGQDDDTLFLNCSLITESDEIANNVASVTDGLRALVALRHGEHEDVMRVIDGLESETDGKSVTVEWEAEGGDVMKAVGGMIAHHHLHGKKHHRHWWKHKRHGHHHHGDDDDDEEDDDEEEEDDDDHHRRRAWWKKMKEQYQKSLHRT